MDTFYNRVGYTVRPALIDGGVLDIPPLDINPMVPSSWSAFGLAYSDDGRYLAQVHRTGASPYDIRVLVFDRVTREWKNVWQDGLLANKGQTRIKCCFRAASYELLITGSATDVGAVNVQTGAIVVAGLNIGYATPRQGGGTANYPGTMDDGLIKAMDSTYMLIQTINPYMFVVDTSTWTMVSVSPSVGTTIAGADYDPVSDRVAIVYSGTLRMFDVSNRLAWVEETGMPALTWTTAEQCLWSPDGEFLAVSYGGFGSGNRLDIWDVSTWTKVSTRNYAVILDQIAWLTARRLLVKPSGAAPEIIDGAVSWISLVTIQPNLNFTWESGASRIAVAPGGEEVAFCPFDSNLISTPAILKANGTSLYELSGDADWNPIIASVPQTGTTTGSVKVSPDGRWMAIATNSATGEKFAVWDLRDRRKYRPFKPADEGSTSARAVYADFSLDSQFVALVYKSPSGNTELHVFNVNDWSVAYTETFQSGVSTIGKPLGVAFSRTHMILLSDTSSAPLNNNRVHFIALGTWVYESPASYIDEAIGNFYDADISPDGRLLAIGWSDGLWVIDLDTFALTTSGLMPAFDDLTGIYITRVKFSPDMETLAFFHSSTSSAKLRFMRVSDWSTIGDGISGIAIRSIGFTSDSRYFIGTTKAGLRYVVDMDTMTEVPQPASPDNAGVFMGFARGKGERWQVRAVVRSGGEAVVREVRMIGPTGTVVATETSDPYYGLVRFPDMGAEHRFGFTLAAVDPADPENQALWWTAEIPGNVPLPELVLSPSTESFDWATDLPHKLFTPECMWRDRPGVDTAGLRTERLIGGAEPDDSNAALFKSAAELKVKLKPEGGYSAPDASTPKRISVRASADNPSTAVTVKLWQGSTMIAEWVQATWPSTPTTLHFELTEAQRAAVTDWDDISVTVGAQ